MKKTKMPKLVKSVDEVMAEIEEKSAAEKEDKKEEIPKILFEDLDSDKEETNAIDSAFDTLVNATSKYELDDLSDFLGIKPSWKHNMKLAISNYEKEKRRDISYYTLAEILKEARKSIEKNGHEPKEFGSTVNKLYESIIKEKKGHILSNMIIIWDATKIDPDKKVKRALEKRLDRYVMARRGIYNKTECIKPIETLLGEEHSIKVANKLYENLIDTFLKKKIDVRDFRNDTRTLYNTSKLKPNFPEEKIQQVYRLFMPNNLLSNDIIIEMKEVIEIFSIKPLKKDVQEAYKLYMDRFKKKRTNAYDTVRRIEYLLDDTHQIPDLNNKDIQALYAGFLNQYYKRKDQDFDKRIYPLKELTKKGNLKREYNKSTMDKALEYFKKKISMESLFSDKIYKENHPMTMYYMRKNEYEDEELKEFRIGMGIKQEQIEKDVLKTYQDCMQKFAAGDSRDNFHTLKRSESLEKEISIYKRLENITGIPIPDDVKLNMLQSIGQEKKE